MNRPNTSQPQYYLVVFGHEDKTDGFKLELATDIKDYYPEKSVTLVHSRDRLMNKFRREMHEILSARMVELNVNLILGERVSLPENGFPEDGSEFDILLQSGKTVRADLAVCCCDPDL